MAFIGFSYYQECQSITQTIYPVEGGYGFTVQYKNYIQNQPHEPGVQGIVIMDYQTAIEQANIIKKGLQINIFNCLTASAFDGTWTQIATPGASTRWGAVGFSIGDKGYMGTGTIGLTELADFWEYDPSSNTWTQKADYGGGARDFASSFVIGDKGYVGTGANSVNYHQSNFFEYNPSSNTWTQKTSYNKSLSKAVGFSVGTKGYIAGGVDATQFHKTIYEYNPSTNKWINKTDCPIDLVAASSFTLSNTAYVITGSTYAYNPSSDSWTLKADYPGPGESASFSIGSRGYTGTGSGGSKLFYEYNPSTNAWTARSDFGGTGRRLGVGFSIGDCGYIGTGRLDSGAYTIDFWNFSEQFSTLSGYVTNNFNNSVSSATITLNNSGGSTTSNDTGYYEITGIPSSTYSITATSPTHQDYSDTVSITADTEKNISMTRLTPALPNVGIIDSSESTLRIGWKENAVVDSVRIYQGTNTNLIATEDTSYVSLASYTVENLDADTGYNFWLEPWDGSVSGSKYYVSGTTDGDGGGGGGGGGDPTPTATGTPGPTAPPYTNYTDEDWLNLTRYEQEYILFEHDTLNVTIGTYTPKPVNVSFWFIVLIAGILSTIYGLFTKGGELMFSGGLVTFVIAMIKLGMF